jgi:hypothetical protein
MPAFELLNQLAREDSSVLGCYASYFQAVAREEI